jgi:hypothetical protein
MPRDWLKLKVVCPLCKCERPAYILKNRYFARTDECPECNHFKPLTAVQRRIIWQCDNVLRMIARKVAEDFRIDQAHADDAAMEQAERFVRRFSRINRGKNKRKAMQASTYIGQCVKVSLRRWAQPDGTGGLAASEGGAELTMEYAAKSDRVAEMIDAADRVAILQSRMTDDEMAIMTDYADGKLPWSEEVERVLAKARAELLRQ